MLTGNAIILIIDSAESRSGLKKDLAQLGYAFTIEASSLAEGSAKIEDGALSGSPISLIMCDWKITKGDEISLLAAFKKSPLLKTTPIILLVSNKELPQALVTSSPYINGYLVKPYTVEVLKNSLPMAWMNQVV